VLKQAGDLSGELVCLDLGVAAAIRPHSTPSLTRARCRRGPQPARLRRTPRPPQPVGPTGRAIDTAPTSSGRRHAPHRRNLLHRQIPHVVQVVEHGRRTAHCPTQR
jgi:hypothetical protein